MKIRLRASLILLALFASLASSFAEDFLIHSFKKIHLTKTFFSEGAHFGDFNRDGKMDVVSGPHWYEGPDFAKAHEYYPPKPFEPTAYSNNFFAFTHDFNGDGWTDILIYGFPGQDASWFVNPQGQDGHWTRHVVFPAVDNESPTWGDLTGDGKPEIIFHTGGKLGWAAPDWNDPSKPWTFHALSPQGGYHKFTHGLGWGDVNGDGRADLLEAGGWWEQPASLANEPEWKKHRVSFGPGGAQMYPCDLDGDGDSDIITSLQAHGYGLAWFEQEQKDGQVTFTQRLIMGNKPEENPYGVKFSQLHAVDLFDMDGDGLKDIITGKRFWAHGPKGDPEPDAPAVLYWFRLVRTAGKPPGFIPYLIDNDSGVGTQVVACDLNGDGLGDVVVGNKKGTCVHLHQTRKVSKEEWEVAQPKLYVQPSKTSGLPPPAPGRPEQGSNPPDWPPGVLPIGKEGKPLNLDFETGDLRDWAIEGEAFKGQPIKDDSVWARGRGQKSNHRGAYWIGGYEKLGDEPQGTMTCAPFKITHPFASFMVGGGGHSTTVVEIVSAEDQKVIFRASGKNHESLLPVVVDLQPHQGKEVYLHLVDKQGGGWAHVNFDDFKFHDQQPVFPKPVLPDMPGVPESPQDVVAHAGLKPEEAVKAMETAEGCRVEIIASEPELHQPIALTIDSRGRLWVAEAHSYPQRQPEGQGKDSIVIFEDADADGRFERRAVFAENLNLVSGLEVGFGGVWVGAAPFLLFIPDKDGDDNPDGPPEVLLDGWGYQDTHETLNAFLWGPDGWLYGCHGVFTHSNVGKPGAPPEQRSPINAGVWRYHPTQHRFEVFAWGTSNPWGVDFNDHGQAFITACVIPHLYHVIQGARYQRQAGAHFQAHTYDDIKTIADHRHYVGGSPHGGNLRSNSSGGGHAHCGAMIYLGDNLPEAYRNSLFFSNIHGNRVNNDVLERKGSGFVGKHGPDFLASNDRWFRGINLKYGPDGSIFLIDWYDKQACHSGNPGAWDRANGRLYRVSHGESKPAAVNLAKLSDQALVELQLHRNDWFVRHARRILQERGPNAQVHLALLHILRENPNVTRKLRALWALHSTGGLTEPLALELTGSEHEYVRAWAIQCALEDSKGSEALRARLSALAKDDPSPVVRLYLASALQRLPAEQRWAIAEGLLSHEADVTDHNLPLLYWYGIEPLAESDPARALSLAKSSKIPLLPNFLARRMTQAPSMDSPSLLIQAVMTADSPGLQLNLLAGMREGFRGRRNVPMPQGWTEAYEKLKASPNPEVGAFAEALAITFGDRRAFPTLRLTLADRQARPEDRQGALDNLLAAKDPELAPVLWDLLTDAAYRGAAVRGLTQFDSPETPAKILAEYRNFNAAEKRDALQTLGGRAPYAKSLLLAVRQNAVPRTDLTASNIRQLRSHGNAELNNLVEEAWGRARDTEPEKAKEIESLKASLTPEMLKAANLPNGRALFAKTCQQCHALFGPGGRVGPDLTGANRGDIDYLLQNVLDPNAVVGKDYLLYHITLNDERIVSGLLREQEDNALTVVTENETVLLPKADVAKVAAIGTSMMPSDQLKPFKPEEVRDLFGYLMSPAQTPILGTIGTLHLFFNGKDLSNWDGDGQLWSVDNGEIVGSSPGIGRNEFLKSHMLLGDFRFIAEVKLLNNQGNSGIQFRSQVLPSGDVKGYQADIGPGWWGMLYEEHGRGLIWDKPGDPHVKPGEWNTCEILAVGNKIRTALNGKLCVDMDDPAGAKSGIIALQLHSGGPTQLRFRNFQIELNPTFKLKTLDPTEEK